MQGFRQQAYKLLGKAKDATFELADAVMTTRHAECLGEFALNPLFRRQWSSAYEALQDCQPEREKLMELYRRANVRCISSSVGSRPYSME